MGIYTKVTNLYSHICEICLFIYGYIYVILISSREERRDTDGQENRQADKSGSSTHTTCLRNWNSHRRNQNDYREYPIGSGGGKPPLPKKYHSPSEKSI